MFQNQIFVETRQQRSKHDRCPFRRLFEVSSRRILSCQKLQRNWGSCNFSVVLQRAVS